MIPDHVTVLHHLTEAIESVSLLMVQLDHGCCMPTEQIKELLQTLAGHLVKGLLLLVAEATGEDALLSLARGVCELAQTQTSSFD